MKPKYLFLFLIVASCTKKTVFCNLPSVAISVYATEPCKANGEVTINTTQNYLYSLNHAPFSGNIKFSNLDTGYHSLKIKDVDGCIFDTTIQIQQTNSGPLFAAVKQVLRQNCLGCHSGINPQAGLNFADNCTILKSWERINERAVIGINGAPMPQGGLMPISERNKIAEWIKAGHGYTN
jgi:uncharacterized membrane protein